MKWFKKMKLAAKLILGFLTICTILAVVGLFGIRNMSTINSMADRMYQMELLGVAYVKEAALNIMYLVRNEKNTILASSEEERKMRSANHENYIRMLDENLSKARQLFHSEQGKELFSRLLTEVDQWKEVNRRVIEIALSEELYEVRGSAALSEGQAREKVNRVQDAINAALTQYKQENARSFSEETTRIYHKSLRVMIGLVAGGVLLGLFLGLSLTRHIATAVGGEPAEIERLARRVADGDLSMSFKSGKRRDTGIYASIKEMVQKLNETMRGVQDASAQVAGSSEELSANAQQLAGVTRSQASTLQETSAAVEELTASVGQVSEHAQSQAASVEESSSNMQQMQRSVEQVSKTLEEVSGSSAEAMERAQAGAEAVRKAVEAIQAIAASSERIAGIVGVIGDIADQTNLLALNASIEAARAGEHGRGFAVVADEVSKLADRSASSTKEVETLIKESGKNVRSGLEIASAALSAMEQIIEGSKKTNRMVEALTGDIEQQITALKEVAQATGSMIAEMSQSISAATEERTTNAKQVAKAIENANDLTRQAASAVEEMSAATEELVGLAQGLLKLVEQFRLANDRKSYNLKWTFRCPNRATAGHAAD